MKKRVFNISIVSVLIVAVLAVGAVAAADSLNIFVSEDGIAAREDLPEVAAVQLFSDENITLTYDMSRSVSGGFADIYKDEKGNDYIYKNGKLTGFYSNEITLPATDATPIGKEEATRIAAEWLSQFSDHVEEYELKSFEEKENYGQYYITFARKLGEIFTNEQAVISVMYDGGVKSVATYNDGKYDSVSQDIVSNITEEELYEYARGKINIIYPDEGSDFEVIDCCLEEDSNGYYISIFGNIDSKLESVRYDLEK